MVQKVIFETIRGLNAQYVKAPDEYRFGMDLDEYQFGMDTDTQLFVGDAKELERLRSIKR